jgi:hypothetical protein
MRATANPQGGNVYAESTRKKNGVTIDPARLSPCGYCRRCIPEKNDPGGCLEVYAHERELLSAGFTPREILTVSWVGAPEAMEGAVEQWEWEVEQGWYE